MSIRFFDMFSGIGGFRSGLEAVGGFECIGHCEIDKHANQAYNAIYQPKGEFYCDDARKINPETMPDFDLTSKALEYLENASAQKNPYAAYLTGKIRLTEDAHRDIAKAIRHFEIAAEGGNDYAEYQLGKIYLYGKETPQDYDKAMEYLNASAEHGNRYAEQLLHNIKNNRNWVAGMGVFRLFRHMGKILENNIRDDKTGGGIDKKLRRHINEKKQAQGLKMG